MLFHIILPLSGGLLVFLGGMKLLEAALRQLGGPLLSSWLNRATASPLKGLLFSSGLTALLQSSTAVTVLTIGLVNAGLLTYGRTLGIILGTNIGTVVTTELLGLQLGRWAMPLLIISLLAWAVSVIIVEREAPFRTKPPSKLLAFQYASLACAGFALLLGGIRVMQAIGPWVSDAGMFRWFLERSGDSMWWAFTAGACLTAIIHSSAAVIGTAISLAAAGALPVEVGIGIVIGSNVGTCVTALIAALGGSRAGHFVAWSHTGLNIAGALLFMPFIDQLAQAAAWMSSGAGAQIAHAQTLFNVICSLAVLPLCYLPFWERMGSLPTVPPTAR